MLKWFRSTSASKWVGAFFNHAVLEMMGFFSLCCLNDAFTYFCLSCFAFLASEELWRQLCCLSAVGVLDVMCKSRREQKVLPSKHSDGLSLHVVLAYFFYPGILISCCHMSNLALWQPFGVLHSLFVLPFFFFVVVYPHTLFFFLLVIGFPELRSWSLPVKKLFWILSI